MDLPTPNKTRSSKNWIALSPRVTAALQHRALATGQTLDPAGRAGDALVFCRPDGQPLRPQRVLDRFRHLSEEAGVPRITVHDLRHLAATLTITAGVPLTVVSKTLRHSTPSTTANIYGHLTRQAAHEAVGTIDAVLTAADHDDARHQGPHRRSPRPHRDHPAGLRSHRRLFYSRLNPASCPAPAQQGLRSATTMRPPQDQTRKGRSLISEKAASDLRQHRRDDRI